MFKGCMLWKKLAFWCLRYKTDVYIIFKTIMRVSLLKVILHCHSFFVIKNHRNMVTVISCHKTSMYDICHPSKDVARKLSVRQTNANHWKLYLWLLISLIACVISFQNVAIDLTVDFAGSYFPDTMYCSYNFCWKLVAVFYHRQNAGHCRL